MVVAGSLVEYTQRKGIVLSVKDSECLIWTKDSYGREIVETAAIDKLLETGYQAGQRIKGYVNIKRSSIRKTFNSHHVKLSYCRVIPLFELVCKI